MRDHRETIRNCLRLSTDRGATDGERAAARAMAEKLSIKYGVSLETVSAPKFDFKGFEDALRRAGERYTNVGTIGDYCFQVLGRHFGDGQGYSYAEVLRMVAVRFPKARTSINSLRWYETRMRKSGLHVPKRKGSSNR